MLSISPWHSVHLYAPISNESWSKELTNKNNDINNPTINNPNHKAEMLPAVMIIINTRTIITMKNFSLRLHIFFKSSPGMKNSPPKHGRSPSPLGQSSLSAPAQGSTETAEFLRSSNCRGLQMMYIAPDNANAIGRIMIEAMHSNPLHWSKIGPIQ